MDQAKKIVLLFHNIDLVLKMFEALTYEELKNVAEFINTHEKELKELTKHIEEKKNILAKFKKEMF